MHTYTSTLIISLSLLSIPLSLNSQEKLVQSHDSVVSHHVIKSLEIAEVTATNSDKEYPKTHVGESRRDKERASGRGKLGSYSGA